MDRLYVLIFILAAVYWGHIIVDAVFAKSASLSRLSAPGKVIFAFVVVMTYVAPVIGCWFLVSWLA